MINVLRDTKILRWIVFIFTTQSIDVSEANCEGMERIESVIHLG